MPLTSRFSDSDGVRYTVGSGTLTDQDLVEFFGTMVANPAYDPSLDHLIDLSGVERFEVTNHGARELAQLMELSDGLIPRGARPKAAAVATSDEGLALLWLYRSVREHRGSRVELAVFRSMANARLWLGLPDAPGVAV
jgi:hypothetical protein